MHWYTSVNTKITLLRVIPTMTFIHCVTGKSSGILSDIFSGIRSGILSGILSGISSGILPGISSGIFSGRCSGISSGRCSGISSGICSGISSGIPSGILSGISSGILSGKSSGIPSGILSSISSGILSGKSAGILSGKHSGTLSGISSGILSDILSGILSGIPSGILSGISSNILSGISSGTLCGISFGVDTRGWGPAGNTGRGWSWLRSGREHWAWMVVVEVRQGTLGVDGRGWGPAGNTGRVWSWLRSGREHCGSRIAVGRGRRGRRGGVGRGRRRKAEAEAEAEGGRQGEAGRGRTRRRRRQEATDIKSNNPHLAGGEKNYQNSDLHCNFDLVYKCTRIPPQYNETCFLSLFIEIESNLLYSHTLLYNVIQCDTMFYFFYIGCFRSVVLNCTCLGISWPRARHPGRDPTEPICMTKVSHGASAKRNSSNPTHIETFIHIPHSSTPETSQILKIWSLDVTSHSSRQFQLKHLEMLQIITIPQYLPQLVLLLAFENEMHSLCLCPSTIWIWSRTSSWAELSASLPVPVLFRNRCGLWCVDESKDHSLSGIGRHHHALEQHFVCWCFCHDHAACKTALGSVASMLNPIHYIIPSKYSQDSRDMFAY